MARPEKVKCVEDTKEILSTSDIAIVADYRGLNVEAITKLRDQLREGDTVSRVIKNTLVSIALTESNVKFDQDLLAGPSFFIFGKNDPVFPAKIAMEFAKKNEFFKIKGGFLKNKQISLADIKNIASLPSRDQLIAQVIGTMNAPIRGLVTVLAGPARSLVCVLEAIKKQKEVN